MAEKIKVVAAKSTECPKEDNFRDYIGDTVPFEIELTSFYRKRLSEGSLILCERKVENKNVNSERTNKKSGGSSK